MAHPYFNELQQLLDEIKLRHSDIECRHFFSGAAAYTKGKIFASLTPKGLAFKMPEPRCDEILSSEIAMPLRYFDKSPVKRGYVLFPDYKNLQKKELKEFFLESRSSAVQNST